MAYFSISGMTTPLQKYQQDLQRDDFLFDAAQQNAVQQLERLYQQFVQDKPVKQGFFDKLLGKKPEITPQSIAISPEKVGGGNGHSITPPSIRLSSNANASMSTPYS